MSKRRELRDDAIRSADLFMSNVDAILRKNRKEPKKFPAHACLKSIANELYSGLWDTVDDAVLEMEER